MFRAPAEEAPLRLFRNIRPVPAGRPPSVNRVTNRLYSAEAPCRAAPPGASVRPHAQTLSKHGDHRLNGGFERGGLQNTDLHDDQLLTGREKSPDNP